jgi:subtilase family serine protease
VTVQVVGDDVSIDQADVRIVGLSVASSGTDVTYTAELKNSGGSPASGFWLDVWLNRTAAPPPPPATGDGYQFVDVLAAGETAEVTVTIYGVNPGTYQSWLLVDSVGSVSEGSLGENNNLWGPEAVTVTGSGDPIGADLSITYLVAYIQESQGQVIYIVDVTNSGDQAAEGFAVGVFSNPEFPPTAPAVPDEQAAVEYLAPGETAYLDVVVRALPEGSWSSWVLADVASAVPEPNESNNLQGFEVAPE